MFDAIATRYDTLNRLMSLGLDGGWRRRLVRALDLPPGGPRVLDVATGTADVAMTLCKMHPTVRVVGIDPSRGMLQIGQTKVNAAGLAGRIELCTGDVQNLAYPDASFDAACVSFGIRNVPDRLAGLREMRRICRPGTRIAVLELGEPPASMMGRLAQVYIHRIVAVLGGLLSRRGAYAYLQKSIAGFLPPDEFVALMRQAGLAEVVHHRLSFGAVNLFVGEVRSRLATPQIDRDLQT
jgi:demethylmenaquinone methyltransferase/2-methoxy-6-polyprenyl-1,4-benzoquinol methylase